MIAVFVAICLAAVPAKACNRDNALDWIAAPERQTSPAACMRHGIAYAAASRLVTPGTYPKVFCKLPGGRPDVAAAEGWGGLT